MAGPVQGAVARQVSSSKLSQHVVDTDGQPAGEQILSVPARRLGPAQLQGVRVAPLRGSGDHDHPGGEAGTLSA